MINREGKVFTPFDDTPANDNNDFEDQASNDGESDMQDKIHDYLKKSYHSSFDYCQISVDMVYLARHSGSIKARERLDMASSLQS